MFDKIHSDKKKIKICRFFFILLWFLSIIMIFNNVSAHSPSDMSLVYDTENQNLEVMITHQVSNPDSHYIYNLKIKKNGEIYDAYDYTNQSSSSSFKYTFEINATEGDNIEVDAFCNQGGSINKQVSIAFENGISDDSNGSSTPGFEIFLFFISLFIITFLCKKLM